MNNPIWFNLILQWKKMGRGLYGISFPFLVGAVDFENRAKIDEKFIRAVFSEIEKNPVEGYYCEVRWCGDIGEPVASIKPLSDLEIISIHSTLNGNNQVSFGFTSDLMSMFNLNCETPEECREKLIIKTFNIVKDGSFSKNGGKFTQFTDDDIKFINNVSNLEHTVS